MKKIFCAVYAAFALPLAAQASPVDDLIHAVERDDVTTVQTLLAAHGDPNVSEPQRGENLLILALREHADHVLPVLLGQPSIQVDQPARNGNTALMMAAYLHNEPAARALLAKGAAVNKPGWSPLHYAAASGDDAIAALLLERQAQIDARAPGELTPLMLAAREGHDRTVVLLLAHGADRLSRNGEHLTAAQIAERAGHPAIAVLLNQAAPNRDK